MGQRSGYNNSTGSSNSALCTNAGRPATSTYDNWTCLGANSVVTGANQVQLGDSATTSYVYGTVQNRSDARDKADIRDTQLGLDFIKALRPVDRSEEHTSELQSLMRISYAVFCLKKHKNLKYK